MGHCVPFRPYTVNIHNKKKYTNEPVMFSRGNAVECRSPTIFPGGTPFLHEKFKPGGNAVPQIDHSVVQLFVYVLFDVFFNHTGPLMSGSTSVC